MSLNLIHQTAKQNNQTIVVVVFDVWRKREEKRKKQKERQSDWRIDTTASLDLFVHFFNFELQTDESQRRCWSSIVLEFIIKQSNIRSHVSPWV